MCVSELLTASDSSCVVGWCWWCIFLCVVVWCCIACAGDCRVCGVVVFMELRVFFFNMVFMGLCVCFVDGCLCGVSGVGFHGVLNETPNKTHCRIHHTIKKRMHVFKKNMSSHSKPLEATQSRWLQHAHRSWSHGCLGQLFQLRARLTKITDRPIAAQPLSR